MSETELTRGELAKLGGVNRETIRFYERNGLLPEPLRSTSGYCLFTPATVRRVRFIKRAQAVGFSLNEIKRLLELQTAPDATRGDVRLLVEAKVADIDEKLAALHAMRHALLKLLDICPGDAGSVHDCPILDSLEDEDGL
ncbi:MAG: heavy metal-responsive transcriptional regulator [Chloroflexi bacterium]|nr:heavy metal-responsive transcriptional regulator [Chloroflexota bacterium]